MHSIVIPRKFNFKMKCVTVGSQFMKVNEKRMDLITVAYELEMI